MGSAKLTKIYREIKEVHSKMHLSPHATKSSFDFYLQQEPLSPDVPQELIPNKG